MPMTQAKAQELLTQYKPKLDSVKLSDNDKVNSIVEPFIPALLNALQVIADPSATPEFFDNAQKILVSSVAQKKGWSQTTLEYLDSKYMSQDVDEKGYVIKAFIKLEEEIREGLKAEAVAEVTSIVEEPAFIAPAPVVITPVDKDNTEAHDDIDWALWLQRGALGVCFVASLAACVIAAMTLNPAIMVVGVAATAVSGFAIAQSFGFFSNHSDDFKEVCPTNSVDPTSSM